MVSHTAFRIMISDGRVRKLERERSFFFNNGILQAIAVLAMTLLVVALIPFVGPITIIMTPLPILYYSFRLGGAQALAALAVAFAAVLLILSFIGRPVNLMTFIMIGFTGVMLTEVLKRRYPLEKTFTVASLMLFFCSVGLILYYGAQDGVSPWRMVEVYIEGAIKDNLILYQQMNMSEDQIAVIRENTKEIARFFTDIFPALTLCGAILTVWLNILAGRSLLRSHIGLFPDFGDLSLWKAPEKLVWLLIISGSMILLPEQALGTIGMNILIVCCMIYLFQGLAITSFFFRHKQIPAAFRVFFYALIAVQQYMLFFIIAVGLGDIWIDFRRRIAGTKDTPV